MKRKWKNISELCKYISEDDMLESCYKDLKRLTYAPNLGYTSWIFSYKRTLVALFDAGNGHYNFQSAVTLLDFIIAKLCVLLRK